MSKKKIKRYHYSPSQLRTLRTCELPGSKAKAKRSWGRKMNKLLGTKCTWAALLHKAKSLRGDWQIGGGRKKVSKPQDNRIKVGKKPAGLMNIQTIEYGLMVNGETIWEGDVEPKIYIGRKSKKISVRIKGEDTRNYDPGTEVEVADKDLD